MKILSDEHGQVPFRTLEALRYKIHRLDDIHIPDSKLSLLQHIPNLWKARRLIESLLVIAHGSTERAHLTLAQLEDLSTLNKRNTFSAERHSIALRICKLTGCPISVNDRRRHHQEMFEGAMDYCKAFGESNTTLCSALEISACKAARIQCYAILEYERCQESHGESINASSDVPEEWPTIVLNIVDAIVTLMRDFEVARRRITFDGAATLFEQTRECWITAKLKNRALNGEMIKRSRAFQRAFFSLELSRLFDEGIHIRRLLPDKRGRDREDVRLSLIAFWRCICQSILQGPSTEREMSICFEKLWSRIRLIFRHLGRCETKPHPVTIARSLKMVACYIKDNLSVHQAVP